MNFALIGLAGFVAPRHLKALRETGSRLVAAVDPHDSVGVIDNYFPKARFFTEIERFDRHLEKLRRSNERVTHVSICSPNYLHDAHVRLALRVDAHAICEKPLVINPWNLDQLAEIEVESGCRVYTVLQLRLHEAFIAIRRRDTHAQVELTYITRRGAWYSVSWKGSDEKSGGIAMNIGIHFFDVLIWLFGPLKETTVCLRTPSRMSGTLELENASVRWFLSVAEEDLPDGGHAYRSITIDGEEIEFTRGFADLHTRVYEDVLAGGGFGIEDARPAIELVHRIRTANVESPGADAHPLVAT